METINPVFQVDSFEVNEVYNTHTNYLIEYSYSADIKSEYNNNYCILYFSSHDIYYPNTSTSFQNQLINKNKFEWYGTRIKKGKKHIFLRDIKKQWYLTGINSEINSIEKLKNFLIKETNGYKIITIGSSAGGFAAVLFGSMLNAEIVFTFNGQFFLADLLSRSSIEIDPIIFRERNNPKINKYYSLRKYLENYKTNILYFFSNKSSWDNEQFNHISDIGINVIPFNTKHHGIPFLKSSLKHVINMPQKELIRLNGITQNPFLFSLKIEGLSSTMKGMFKQIYKSIKRKMLP
ncbi:MAG: hypothetical protein JXR36_16340 [Bacteroidales bacterium]|nr:hypothetical protein [Bacteroidales bacterium]